MIEDLRKDARRQVIVKIDAAREKVAEMRSGLASPGQGELLKTIEDF